MGIVDAGGRQIRVGLPAANGLALSRYVYMPPSGGFIRYVEVIENRTSAPVEAVLGENTNYGSVRVLVDAPSVGGAYAIGDALGGCCDETLGRVFGGIGAPVSLAPDLYSYGPFSGTQGWRVMVPPGERRALMHFVIRRGPGDLAGTEAQARALRDLTDPDALTGVSEEVRALIQNFIVP